MKNVLFICSRNKLRSPTAEAIFATRTGIETDSAGLAVDAACVLDKDQLAWADVIFVMEKRHRTVLARRFKNYLAGKKVVCLDIPDNYQVMQPELVALLEKRVPPHLR
ncbi:MAG: phosphotyrosine protein phosphatase [Comamonadaceae bacterium]|nr:MAG: phosphotyrosine protein phosphatase [Comamonadaceae bacterium]